MDKTLALFLLLLLLAGALESQARYAESEAGQFYIMPGMLLLGRERGRDFDSVAAPSIGLGFQSTDRLGIELHAAHGETAVRGAGGPDVDVTAFRLDGLYRLGGDAWQSYVVGGVSRTHYNVFGDANDNASGASLGLGLRRAITDRLSLQLDGRGVFDFDETKLQPGATLGLRYVVRGPVTPRSVAAEAAPKPRAEPAPPLRPVRESESMLPPRLEAVVEFDFDAADLRADQLSELDRVVRFMREYTDARARLEGHTDNRGSESYNLRLSERRAHAVRDHLVAAGIEPSRIMTAGQGTRQPVASNDTDEGRQRNRRVVAIAVGSVVPSSGSR